METFNITFKCKIMIADTGAASSGCWRRSYHDFLVAEQHAVSTDPPVVVFHQVSEDQLDSGSGLVPVSRGLISLDLVVSSHSTDEDRHSRRDGSRKVFGLAIQTEGIGLAPANICSMLTIRMHWSSLMTAPCCRWPWSWRHCSCLMLCLQKRNAESIK